MDRKRFLPLLVSSAMLCLWACGEGEISRAEDADEMAKKIVTEKSDYEFASYYVEYCKKQKDCKVEFVKSCSSAKSSSSGKGSSSSAKSSSSGKGSSSSAKSSSSGKPGSSSSFVPTVSGKCDLVKPSVVHVGDTVIWRYLPNEKSIESDKYEWSVSNEVEKSIVAGELSGIGTPKITVVFKTIGKKYGPELTFGGKEFDCADTVIVVEKSVDPVSSSSQSSSSAPPSSSSKPKSSSSSTPEGHCAVSKHKVEVGESVDWYVAGPNEEVLEGKYNWRDLGDGGELVDPQTQSLEGRGSTKITVKYSQSGPKEAQVQFGIQVLMCDLDSDGNQLLEVVNKPETSSSSAPPVVSSSSVVRSSSSRAQSSSSAIDIIL